MERPDDQAPIARERWQRLLARDADSPPETTDARIRAHARRGLVPRGRRWWLPVSLAASFVLAVMIAQLQFGPNRRAPMTESDDSPAAAPPRSKAAAAPVVGGPEREVRAASELAAEPALTAPVMMESTAAARAAPPAPEAWYAAIEKLRAEGRLEEAERELEQLRKAWPGWLEQQAERLKKEERR